jgi:NADPH-dependent 2,4-dienoyl-CoA reductase/sulfur reductase-like enzyme
MVNAGKTQQGSRTVARKLAVIGAGLMGSGIAQVSAQAGWDVVLRDVTDEALTRGTDGIKASYDKFVSKGKLDAHAADAALGVSPRPPIWTRSPTPTSSSRPSSRSWKSSTRSSVRSTSW